MNQQEMFEVAQQDRIKAKNEALKMAIDVMEGRCAWGKSKQEVIAMCQEALEL